MLVFLSLTQFLEFCCLKFESLQVLMMVNYQVEKAQLMQTLLFVSGINTLLQTWFGSRMPVVVGGSLRFLVPSLYVAFSQRYFIYLNPNVVSSSSYLFSTWFCIDALKNPHLLVTDAFSFRWLRGFYERWGECKARSWSPQYFLCCSAFWGFGEFLWGVVMLKFEVLGVVFWHLVE